MQKKIYKIILKSVILLSLIYLFSCQVRDYDKTRENALQYLALCPDKTVSKCTSNCISRENCSKSSSIKGKKDGVKYYTDAEAQCRADCSSDCNKYCGTSLLLIQ